MITKLFKQFIISLMNNCMYHKVIFALLILPLSLISQVSFDKIPLNKQLVVRDTITNIGIVIFEGFVDNTSTPYNSIEVNVFRNGIPYGITYTQTLNYSGNLAPFTFNITIDAELAKYSFDVFGIMGGNSTLIETVNDIVAGDVFIIEGQSNAVASMYEGSANANQSDYIRVYASGTINTQTLVSQDAWYYGNGDVSAGATGNTGQWGLKFARSIIDKYQIPVAIFNGATGNQAISYFERPADYQVSLDSNYGKLFYRLRKTGLKESVRAIIWSQGENDAIPINNTSTQEYIDAFTNLKTSWISDYPNIKMIYIFQTKSGCGVSADNNILKIKEAQRLLAEADTSIQIIQTTGLSYAAGQACHFSFIGGYELFGIRVFNLVDRDFYGGNYNSDVETPMVVDAYLQDLTKLVLETDAISLANNTISTSVFALENSGGVSISSVDVLNNLIIFQLSGNPGASTTISYLGLNNGQNSTNLITNTQNIEIVCFGKVPIDVSINTIWNGSSWSHGAPVPTMNASVEGNYSASNGNIITNNLLVNSNLNFDNGTINSVIVYGNLTVNGNFAIGDTESLVMKDDSSVVTGFITKNESSTNRNNIHDFTYWSSPIEVAPISNVFVNVAPSRIFYYDQSQSSETNPAVADYWTVWRAASGNMNVGFGYAAEGTSNGVHNISFTGKPNNGVISVPIVFQDPGNDFNLIGNPYPSAIDIEKFFLANTNLDGTAYLWTHNTEISGGSTGDFVTDDYALFNSSGGTQANSGGTTPTKNIGSGQGFFVTAINAGSVMFNNSMRLENANDQFFKSNTIKSKLIEEHDSEKDRIWLNLTTENGGFNQLLIGFTKEATDSLDRRFDALKFKGTSNPISFYSVMNNKKYTIQGLSPIDTKKNVRLGFDTNIAPRLFTVSIDKIEGVLKDSDIFLEDTELEIVHDLKKSNYTFLQSEISENPNRFILRFENVKSIDVDNKSDNEEIDFIIYNTDDGNIGVKANIIVSKVKVYNSLGKELIIDMPYQSSFNLNTDNIKYGTLLLIEVTFENGEVERKKTIRF